jgi:lipoprotein-releasing system permease protein
MNLRYVRNELYYQKRRTLAAVIGLSIGIAVLITLNALSMAYRRAARVPLQEIGADLTVQRSGNVPKDLTGAVFPCSAVTIRNDEVKKIETLPGVRGVGKAVLLWVFDPDRAWIVLGVEQQNPIGPAILRHSVIQGRFLKEGKPEAVVEVSFARQFGIKVGDTLSLARTDYPVVGLVEASRAAKIGLANVYLPLSEAQRIAASSAQVQAVSPFSPADVNLLFIKADEERISALSSTLRTMMGKSATIGSPASFLKLLGSLFALSDKFTPS